MGNDKAVAHFTIRLLAILLVRISSLPHHLVLQEL